MSVQTPGHGRCRREEAPVARSPWGTTTFLLCPSPVLPGQRSAQLRQHRVSPEPFLVEPHAGGNFIAKEMPVMKKEIGGGENFFRACHVQASLIFFPVSRWPVDVTKWEGHASRSWAWAPSPRGGHPPGEDSLFSHTECSRGAGCLGFVCLMSPCLPAT